MSDDIAKALNAMPDMARLLARYHASLVEAGFTREEALLFVRDLQTSQLSRAGLASALEQVLKRFPGLSGGVGA